MEILLALLFLLFGNVEENNPQITLEQIIHTVVQSQFEQPNGGGAPGEGEGEIDPEQEPLPNDGITKMDPQKDTAPTIRGIFATAHTVGGSNLERILKLVDETDLNALVIDIKKDEGIITYKMDIPGIEKLGTTSPIIRDIDALMTTLEEHNIYPIARIVVFKDTVLAEKEPELSFLNNDGSVWRNNRGESFVNPYLEEVWEYNIEVAKEAARVGFKEIQFDYVRFPEGFENRADSLIYHKDDRSRIDVINQFVEYAREQLYPLGARTSVDIFGFAASVPAAEGIGQDFNGISRHVDVISPMVYPSHYSTGWFGQKVPDAAPYETIDGAMKDTIEKLSEIEDVKPIIRPWIQDFTATWIAGYIRYEKEEVEAQIRALKANGIDEFLLWNSSNVYSPGVNYLVE